VSARKDGRAARYIWIGLGLFALGVGSLGWVVWQWASCTDGATCTFHKDAGNVVFAVSPVLMIVGVSSFAFGLGRWSR
jgi:hypothetical protein